MNFLPKLNHLPGSHAEQTIHVDPIIAELAPLTISAVLTRLKSALSGLSSQEAAQRLIEVGANVVAINTRGGGWWRLIKALRNPLVILLLVLASLAFATGDTAAGSIMLAMVTLSVVLRFFQEARADAAAAQLTNMIRVTANVLRDGKNQEISIKELVPGDIVTLAAGDMIPADLQLISAKDLFINQASLTGESLPVEKHAAPNTTIHQEHLELNNICFLGTSVESGAATAVILTTGAHTYFGSMAKSLVDEPAPTGFDKGVQQFTGLMLRFMLIMVPLVFVINGLTKQDWHSAFFFALAVAVGLTPEMLPMIVSVCLAKGAVAMAKKKVIVKQLGAIQNFGAMDVLCTDKTGTLTLDQVILQKHCDVLRNENEAVFRDAYLIAYFQTGLKNMLDRAVLEHEQGDVAMVKGFTKVDEIPFDFVRKMMSVVVATPAQDHLLLTKGAPEAVFPRCNFYELNGEILPLEPARTTELISHYEQLNAEGFRVLAVAYKSLPLGEFISKEDESDLILKGYIAFLDPPKDSATQAIIALQKHGVQVKVLTGDNDIVTRRVCSLVGIQADFLLLGSQIETMTDAQLADTAESTQIFARLSPEHKRRIIRALQAKGHVVGFMGDGINDSPALHVADVGISVDSAVDIAKAAASVILLEKNLMVLDEGVIEGRKVFVNILRYIRMGASSNFGNMLSLLGASAFLPFLPMAPLQVLTNNLLYDFAQVPIPTDNVNPEFTAQPRPWDISGIKKFVLCIGPISSLFDYTTFWVMLSVFDCWNPANKSLFQTGWFVESLITQTLIIHIIRTNKIPFIQGSASWQLTLTSCFIVAIAIALPFSPLAQVLGFTPLPPLYWAFLAATVLGYGLLTQGVKTWLVRRAWI